MRNFLSAFGGHHISLNIPPVSKRKDPQKGREAAAPSNIKEIQEIQGGQEAPHDGDAISPKDA
jgi:hypothetical protein